jgi:hypothetical protein
MPTVAPKFYGTRDILRSVHRARLRVQEQKRLLLERQRLDQDALPPPVLTSTLAANSHLTGAIEVGIDAVLTPATLEA